MSVDWRTTFVGRMPVVVVRTEDGGIAAFENRCLHRGALICFDDPRQRPRFHLLYHAWRYDLSGNLKSIAFRKGVDGKGGMPAQAFTPRTMPSESCASPIGGIVFGTFSDLRQPSRTISAPMLPSP